MDLIGPLFETPAGNRHIMTLTNYLSRWAVSFALKDKTAESVTDCLGDLICHYGVPERIISDQGREFVNVVNKQLCTDMDIKHSLCTAYHPQSNGLTERFNQTLERVLAKIIDDEQTNWDRKLKWATFSYNVSWQSSLKATPFSMMYGVEARLPLDVQGADTAGCDWSDVPDEDVALQTLPSVQLMGKENIKKAQAKQKGIYDAKHKGVTFTGGDKVMYHNNKNVARKGGKMEAKRLGPKVIEEVFTNGTAQLQGLNRVQSTKFLKHYQSGSPTSSSAAAVLSAPASPPSRLGDGTN